MQKLVVGIALAALAVPVNSQDIPPVAKTSMVPAGPWGVDYGHYQCALARSFSAGGESHRMVLTVEPLTDRAWLRLTNDGRVRRDDGDAVVVADGQRFPQSVHYNFYSDGKQTVREYMLDLGTHRLGTLNRTLRLWTRKHGDYEFNVEGWDQAWKALNGCMVNLHASLGIDNQVIVAMAQKPKGNALNFVRLPRNLDHLEFALLYWVTADGRVDECRLLQPSGDKQFDNSLCSGLLERARMEPARTRDGTPGTPIRAPLFEHLELRRQTFMTVSPIQQH